MFFMDIRKITEQLTEGSGVSGNCHTMTKAKELLEEYAHVRTDALGSIIGTVGDGKTQIMLDAHLDRIGLIVTAIFNGIINFPKKKKDQEAQQNADRQLLKKGIQALLKNDLKVRYDYWMEAGYAPEDAKDDLESEYQIYHSLGKNGVMDSRRERFLKLPTEPPEA